VVIRGGTRKILKTSFCNGKKHDFRLFKESRVLLRKDTALQADSGYQGIYRIHGCATIPRKNTKKNPLTRDDKQFNHELSKKRIEVENVLASLKKFRILSDRYRNRRKRFGLRFNIIAGIHNYELDF
jgi:transposase